MLRTSGNLPLVSHRNPNVSFGLPFSSSRFWPSSQTNVNFVDRQNNVDDLYSLFRFLRVDQLQDWPYFQRTISKPLKDDPGSREALEKLHVCLFVSYALHESQLLTTAHPLKHRRPSVT